MAFKANKAGKVVQLRQSQDVEGDIRSKGYINDTYPINRWIRKCQHFTKGKQGTDKENKGGLVENVIK